jgi:hypothetical protein
MEGLEPPHLAASDPKSDVSTNFTTSGKNLLNFRAAKVGGFNDSYALESMLFRKFAFAGNDYHHTCLYPYSRRGKKGNTAALPQFVAFAQN